MYSVVLCASIQYGGNSGKATQVNTSQHQQVFEYHTLDIHSFFVYVYLQMNLRGAQSISFFSFLKEVSKERGFLSLYKGLEAGIVRQIFYATSRFGLFEVIRDQVAKHREVDFSSRLFSGVTSGALAALISCPAEVTLVRISNDATLPVEQRRNYKGVFNGFTRIFAEEGMSAFFRGSGPFVNRAMLVGAVQVGTYDQFKTTYRGFGITSTLSNTFAAAMTSGLLYSIVTMPFETAKNQMAFQKPDANTGRKLILFGELYCWSITGVS